MNMIHIAELNVERIWEYEFKTILTVFYATLPYSIQGLDIIETQYRVNSFNMKRSRNGMEHFHM